MSKKQSSATKKRKTNNFSSMFNSLKPAQIFMINTILLTMAIVLLTLALWVQHANHTAAPFGGYTVGSTVTQGTTSIRVDSVSSTKGKGVFTSPPNRHYLIVSLTVKNTSSKPINVFPSSDTYVKDDSGTVTFLTPYALKQPFRAGELPPGEQIKGQLSYLVSEGKPQKLYIDAVWGGGVVAFAVQD